MAFAVAALYSKPFFAPKALHLLVIDCPAFSAGVVIRGSEPTSWVVLGVLAKPGSQGGVGDPLAWQRRLRVAGLRGAARSRGRQTVR